MTFVKRVQKRNSWNQEEKPVDNACFLGKLAHDVKFFLKNIELADESHRRGQGMPTEMSIKAIEATVLQ